KGPASRRGGPPRQGVQPRLRATHGGARGRVRVALAAFAATPFRFALQPFSCRFLAALESTCTVREMIARSPSALLAAGAAVAAAVVGFSLWDARGHRLLRKLDADVARQEAANEALREENARLARRVKRLSGPDDAEALE